MITKEDAVDGIMLLLKQYSYKTFGPKFRHNGKKDISLLHFRALEAWNNIEGEDEDEPEND